MKSVSSNKKFIMAKLCELKDIFPSFFNYQVFSCIKRFCEKNIIQLVNNTMTLNLNHF